MIHSLRKADFLLFFFFAALAAVIAAAPLFRPASDPGGEELVRITCRGEEIGLYPLEKDAEIEILRNGHRNLVSIQDHTVRMDSSDCKNQVCVDTGRISRTGEMIVCLPNRVVVEILSSAQGGEEDEEEEAIDAVVK